MQNFNNEEYLKIAEIIAEHGFEDISEKIKNNLASGSNAFYGYLINSNYDKHKIKLHLNLSQHLNSFTLDTVYKQRSREIDIKSVKGFTDSMQRLMNSFDKSEKETQIINAEMKKRTNDLYAHWSSAFPEGTIKVKTMRLGAVDSHIMNLSYKGFDITLQDSKTHSITVCDNEVTLSPEGLKRYLDSVAWVIES